MGTAPFAVDNLLWIKHSSKQRPTVQLSILMLQWCMSPSR